MSFDRESHVQFDREKLKALILYTCFRCEPSKLGAVKLHKVLYFTDMLHYALAGAPVTGATYRKRSFGPTCDDLPLILRDLERDGGMEIKKTDYFGYSKSEYVPLRTPELERLNKTELALLNEVIDFVCANNTAKTISDFSHNRAWEMAEFGAVLPYRSAFHLFPIQVSQEAMEWASGEADKIEPDKIVGSASFRDFRDRVLEARRK